MGSTLFPLGTQLGAFLVRARPGSRHVRMGSTLFFQRAGFFLQAGRACCGGRHGGVLGPLLFLRLGFLHLGRSALHGLFFFESTLLQALGALSCLFGALLHARLALQFLLRALFTALFVVTLALGAL